MKELQASLDGTGRSFALVVSRFNESVTEGLITGARRCLLQHGVDQDAIHLVRVPGAWELPGAVQRIVDTERYDGVIALGCVIRGETPHFDYIAGAAINGLGGIASSAPVPVTMGLLTTETPEQALARSGGKSGNKGWDAALAVLEMAALFQLLKVAGEGT